ncbi:MAG: hypothetical protein HFH89_00420 [Lachnospiraceae bacterium]|nr:DUF6020 family protein [uncultured Acetatifactor sp.]MCI8286139.1 hypothetical protein [Lachnospiraceae bacterium]
MKQKEQASLLSKPISYMLFGTAGFLFLFCSLTGRDLAKEGNILWTGRYIFRTLGLSLILGGALGSGICFLFRRAADSERQARSKPRTGSLPIWLSWLGERTSGSGTGKVFTVSLCLTFLAWIPAFLAYYPAVCAYDMPVQLGQIAGNFYNDHHPIAHTLLIKWAMALGEKLFTGSGAANAGIAVYALGQMMLLAAAFSFGMTLMWCRRVRFVWLLTVQLLCMFYPFHWYMSVSVTKDTVFSAFFVFLTLVLGEISDNPKKRQFWFCYFGAAAGMILFRNNGKYAFLVLLAVLVPAFCFGKERRRFWGRLLAVSLGAFMAGNVLLTGIFHATGAEQGDRREMLSMPIQQLARTMVYHGGVGVLPEDDNTMEEADKALINDFILNEAYRNYRPDFADPVKSNTNTYVARYRAGEFIRTYLHLFVRYPGDFVNAALAVNAGYLYPGDVSHAWVNAQEGQAAGGGYVQTRWDAEIEMSGIYKDSKWPRLYEGLEKWADGNAYLKIPGVKYLFVPGTWVWLYLLLTLWLLLRRNFGRCICLVPIWGYFLTLLLGPTVQLRYIYPIMIVFPFLLFMGKRVTVQEFQEPLRKRGSRSVTDEPIH